MFPCLSQVILWKNYENAMICDDQYCINKSTAPWYHHITNAFHCKLSHRLRKKGKQETELNMKFWSRKTEIVFSRSPIVLKMYFYIVPACTLMVLSFITASKSSLAQTDLFYALNEHLSNESLGGICSCNSARHNSKELIQLIVASPPEFYKRPCQNLCSDLFKVSIKCQRFQLYPKIIF